MIQANSFEPMGQQYQEKVLAAVLTDNIFADQMSDVLDPRFFTFVHLEAIARAFFKYKEKYREFPSIDLIPTLLKHDELFKTDDLTHTIAVRYLKQVVDNPLEGDRKWIQESSLEFCRRQAVLEAMRQGLEDVENQDYSSLSRRLREALERGSPKDHGHEYGDELDRRVNEVNHERVPTGWPALDKVLKGGWRKGTLGTFIAATGVGKSMFLVNVACALAAQGLNVLYVSLELSEVDIGLRADSWFAEIPIDDVKNNRDLVEQKIKEQMKGRLIIKQWPTKRATVETIRNHVTRLVATKGFRPDAIIIDYLDLMRPLTRYGEKRHDLEGNYEEARALMQELNVIGITADQTNRDGLEVDLVTIAHIGESYAKAQVCDLIMTITRNQVMKENGIGKLYNAKSRLGSDGQVLEFLMDTSKSIKVTVLEHGMDSARHMMNDEQSRREYMRSRLTKISGLRTKEIVQ